MIVVGAKKPVPNYIDWKAAKAPLLNAQFAIRVLIMGLLSTLFGCGKQNASNNETTPQQSGGYETAEPYTKLRTQVLQLRAGDIELPPSDAVEPVVILMETGYPEAVATLIAVADGTTSMYFSNGGGVIGAGEHDAVRTVSLAFLGKAPDFLTELTPTDNFPLPEEGRVRFYLVVDGGVLTAEAAEEDLGEGRHALSPLFLEGHRVIAAVREHASG